MVSPWCIIFLKTLGYGMLINIDVWWQSVEQIGSRADRMKIETEDLFLYSSTDIEVRILGFCWLNLVFAVTLTQLEITKTRLLLPFILFYINLVHCREILGIHEDFVCLLTIDLISVMWSDASFATFLDGQSLVHAPTNSFLCFKIKHVVNKTDTLYWRITISKWLRH